MRSPRADPAWTLVGIRVAYWIGAALALLWLPLRSAVAPFRAYEARTDLLFNTFAQWDAQWFVHIADHGYDSKQATPFFPLYPLLVHALSQAIGSTVVAGVLLSLVAAGVAAVVLVEIARPLLGPGGARDSLLLVALYPLAFVFTAVQSDALFLALSAGAFLAALRGRVLIAGMCGGLAVATRLVGLALLPALLLLLWPRRARELLRPAPLLLLPATLGAYMAYLHEHVGDALAFQHAQKIFWLRRTHALGPLSGLWESIQSGRRGAAELVLHLPRGQGGEHGYMAREQVATWNAIHLLLLLAALALTWVAWKRLGPAFGLYSLATLALVLLSPPAYFPLASFDRYLLADFPVFLALAALLRNHPRARQIVLFTFAAVGAVAAVGYSRKVWIG
ncbi:MAG TPA: mannosyltransferase family protein [Gaiellaceae bacterium]|nr:mannosyltransferase family protein [Gaiellaceae bacterium]